ncbi:MAG: hypothetical protein GXP39_07545 [Chloroflexi bacterium]|nr:hypothetical protein [Chloroflexota bacterium]
MATRAPGRPELIAVPSKPGAHRISGVVNTVPTPANSSSNHVSRISERSLRLLTGLRAIALIIIALHLSAPALGETRAWGLWPTTYLPPWARWPLAGLAVLLCYPPITRRAAAFAERILARVTIRRLPLLLALIGLPLFWRFRLVHTRWGDAYILSQAIAHPDVHLTYTWQAPLTVYLHAQLWALGHRLWGWSDAMPPYALTSVLAGGIFLYALARLAIETSRDRYAAAITFGLVATLGTIQLFFGYVENYSLMTLGMMIYLWLAWRCLQDQIPLLWPATALALTHALHPSSIVLAPSLLYLGWVWARKGEERRYGAAAWQIILPMVIVAGGVILLMEQGGHGLRYLVGEDRPGGGDGKWFVPLFAATTRWEHYTMFSWGHLVDMLNEQLLTAPMALWTLVALAALAWPRVRTGSTWTRLLAIAAGLYLLFIWTWNPDYGGQRDWDLFAPAAVPLTLLTVDRLMAALPERSAQLEAGILLIATQAFHTIAWVYQNTLPWSWPD